MNIDINEQTKEQNLLKKLEIQVSRKLNGQLHGNYLGLLPGQGTELGETRQYSPGDDVRRIDWNVTARLREPYVRETIADRELNVWFVLDNSKRVQFGTALYQKSDLLLAATAALGFIVLGGGNRIGAIISTGDNQIIIPKKQSKKHFLHLLNTINQDSDQATGITDLNKLLIKTHSINKGRNLIILISDFLVDDDWHTSLKATANTNDVLAIQLWDQRDYYLPDVGLVPLEDPATNEIITVDTSNKEIREKFNSAAQKRQDELDQFFQHSKIDHLKLRTDKDWIEEIVSYVNRRKMRAKSRV